MIMTLATILAVLLVIRGIEYRLFVKKTMRACHVYDCAHAAKRFEEHNDASLVREMFSDGYELSSDWSAFNFVMFEGPSPITMFFSFKPLTINSQYDSEVVKKLNRYAIA